mgnify:CR=1 FL=1
MLVSLRLDLLTSGSWGLFVVTDLVPRLAGNGCQKLGKRCVNCWDILLIRQISTKIVLF